MLLNIFQIFAGSVFQTDYFRLQNFESWCKTVRNTTEIEYQLCICKALSLYLRAVKLKWWVTDVFRHLSESWSSILVFLFPKSKQNLKMALTACIFYKKKTYLRGSMATHPKSSKRELHHSHFEEFAFWLIEVIEAAAFE